MATKRGKIGEGKAAVLQCVVRHGKGTAKGVADELGLSRPTVAEHLRHLVEEGKLTKERVGMTHFFAPATVKGEAADCQADEAGHAAEDRRRELYVDEIVRDAVAKSADHDPAPTPLGAAADTSPPQPAAPAAPSPSTEAESPAAGIDPEDGMTDKEAAGRLCAAVFHDVQTSEVITPVEILSQLERLDDAARSQALRCIWILWGDWIIDDWRKSREGIA